MGSERVFAHAEASKRAAIQLDGHDIESIDRAYTDGGPARGRPTKIVARTIKGFGASERAKQEGKHGQPLKDLGNRGRRAAAGRAGATDQDGGGRCRGLYSLVRVSPSGNTSLSRPVSTS